MVSQASNHSLEFITMFDFPPYALASVGDRYVIIGGGGGSAKTGIKNKFEVYQLFHNGKQTTCRRVLSYDIGENCISNLAAWPEGGSEGKGGCTTPCPTILLAVGQEEATVLMRLVPRLVMDKDDDGTMQHQTKATLASNAYYTFNVTRLCSFSTVFKRSPTAAPPPGVVRRSAAVHEDVYQKVCRVSRDRGCLATAGTDGYIRLWSLQQVSQPVLLKTIHAHDRDLDQLDLRPDGRHVVSVCKLTRECCVWDCQSSKKVIQLALETQAIKYKFAWARYGCVEGSGSNVRLFTVSNAVAGSKHPGIVAKWCGKTYALERRQALEGVLSNLAVTEDGRYLATGSMSGDIVIMVAFSLQVLQRVPNAHDNFVTGVEWLPCRRRTSCVVRGFSDASVLSVSCDNTLQVCHVPAVTMMPVWLVAVLAALVLVATFVTASYLGL